MKVSVPLRGDDLLTLKEDTLVCIGDDLHPTNAPPCPVGTPMRVKAVALPFVYLKMPQHVLDAMPYQTLVEQLVCVDTRYWPLRRLPLTVIGVKNADPSPRKKRGDEPPEGSPSCVFTP